jgi:hypothetical protein
MTLTGKLDFEGDTARIEGDSQASRKMLPAAAHCARTLRKGMIVDCEIVTEGSKGGWISLIKEHKDAVQPAKREETKPCTSPSTPVSPALKTVEGQITFVDPAAHKITVKDRAGASHTFIWPPALHDKMSQQKQWWFIKATGEHQADVDLWKLVSTDFFKRPDDWPAGNGGKGFGGNRPYTPRNEKPMVYESAFKSCADLVRDTDFPGMSYADRVEQVRIAAEKVAKWIVTEGGA